MRLPRLVKLVALLAMAALMASSLLMMGRNDLMEALMEGPLDAADPRLLHHVKNRYLVPPSSAPYNLKEDHSLPADRGYLSYLNSTLGWQQLHRLVLTLFDQQEQQPPGFFVEAGALDGEYLSNTLYLERKKNWSGLLVEPDAEMFEHLLQKNRRAWTSHSCLATTEFPRKKTLVKMVRKGVYETGYRAHNTLYGSIYSQVGTAVGYEVFERVQCLPLQTLLLALAVTHVNFVSLDIEGVEEEVVQAFWGGGVTVDVWLVEHHNPYSSTDTRDDTFIKIFELQGYSLYTIITDLQPFNYVFIRQNSAIHDTAFAKRPSEFDLKE